MAGTTARAFLEEQVRREYGEYWGLDDEAAFREIVDAWLDDENTSRHRYDLLRAFLPDAHRVLDMASGCGSAVFHGLLNGYDAVGVDPEAWKATFNPLKAREKGYPAGWGTRFARAVGERLPFRDDAFDAVLSYQTLEHVQDLDACVAEMVRVVRPGGGIHINGGDYGSTFEGHYRVPWLPHMPRPLARRWVRALGRPEKGLASLTYATGRWVHRAVRRVVRENPGLEVRVVNVDYAMARRKLRAAGVPEVPGADAAAFAAYRTLRYARNLFRNMVHMNIIVHVDVKPDA